MKLKKHFTLILILVNLNVAAEPLDVDGVWLTEDKDAEVLEDGTIYDPDSGKTYDSSMKLKAV